ncbi:glycosyltransferase family A protein [Conexibacter sp. CPCC 206217]|uniref:glycosyltransferase family A protein n=1 Tax=Conexibacter sp. CPCC 206217 TaxID=3064574 RepID=UPI002728DAC0|nr:glycosyltransferase family A protein [Conexibacter sp. CPCC 206217]MDO8213887.1 glycosyltransferase family A protein [Conexibacter sp. CPCC 206217]
MRPPHVSVLVTAHDDANRIGVTLDDVFAQDYPADFTELIVVDDGSRDATPELLEAYSEHFLGRIRVLRQPHAGPTAALDRALREARGELFALLVAGDRWPRGRLTAQAALMRRRPEVGLVYSELLPRGGEPTSTPSLWPAELEMDPPRGRPVGQLLREECIAASSIMVRSALRDQLTPIPPQIPRAGWWLTVRAATVADVEWLPEVPGILESLARPPSDRATRLRETLAFQRWFLRHTTSESSFLSELGEIWQAFGETARRLLAATDDPFSELVGVTDAERADARRIFGDARAAMARGDARAGMALAARAAATDPWCEPARTLLNDALTARPRRSPSDPLLGARHFVTLAFADELTRAPALLEAYARHFDGHADATLAIDASALTPSDAERELGALIKQLGLDRPNSAHLIAVLGPIDAAVRERLPSSVDALLTTVARAVPAAPAYDAGSVSALRTYAARASAA